MPKVDGLLETSLYFDDLEGAARFYGEVIGLPELFRDPRLVAMDAGRSGVLLLFRRGASVGGSELPGGHIPGHDGSGPLHMAFGIPAGTYEEWRDHLTTHKIVIHGEMRWPRGGKSLYFEDPEGHAIELATPGLWQTR